MMIASLLVLLPPLALAETRTHELDQYPVTLCDGRACRPGEGNPTVTHSSNPYKLPPIGADFLKAPPHGPEPHSPQYERLVAAAHAAAKHHTVIMCAADFDYRELAQNWHRATARLGLTNALVYALDAAAYAFLSSSGVPAVDGSANVDAWNRTRVQRHIQRAEAERHLAAAAIAASGLDVLLTDTTHVMLRDVMPSLHAVAKSGVDMAVVRGRCTGKPPLGCGLWWNMNWLRGAGTPEARARAVAVQQAGVRKGMVDFYLRWFNGAHAIVNGFGKLFGGCGVKLDDVTPAELASEAFNATTVFLTATCGLAEGDLRVALLPPSFMNQEKLFGALEQPSGSLESLLFRPPKPAQRDRLNLNRYDEQDFQEVVSGLKAGGAWFL